MSHVGRAARLSVGGRTSVMGRKSHPFGGRWALDADGEGVPGPLVLGHRGAPERAPENTVASVVAAFDEGADGVEIDVRVTADGVAVAFHDPELPPPDETPIAEVPLSRLRELDLGGDPSPEARAATLEEIAQAAHGRGGLMLEIKNLPGQPGFDAVHEGAADAAVAVLRGSGGPGLIASFNPRSIERCRSHAPEVPTGFLSTAAMDPTAALRYVEAIGHTWVMPQVPALMVAGEDLVRRAHDAGVLVGTWVANDREMIRQLFDWGVDAVVTDRPAVAVAVRDRSAGGA